MLFAARTGNLDAIARIFSRAADGSISVDANERDFNGCTPLMEASSRGNFRIVKLLKSKGARMNVKDKRGNTALVFAAERGNLQVVKLLVRQPKNKDTHLVCVAEQMADSRTRSRREEIG